MDCADRAVATARERWRGGEAHAILRPSISALDAGVEFKLYHGASRRAIGLRERFETVATPFLGLD